MLPSIRVFGLVCKLRHFLQGLKQPPLAWFGLGIQALLFNSSKTSERKSLFFYRRDSSDHCIYQVIYEDDITITDSDHDNI